MANFNQRKPSEEKIWLQHYKDNAFELAQKIPNEMTIWDVIEEKLLEFVDYPAIEYFKREISRPEFIENVYIWARTFRAMGVEKDEIVPIYGPFFPDICAMIFALNAIGATSYFLKLAISKEALIKETSESKIAVVYDGMWENVKEVFSDQRFKKVLVATASDVMISPKKEIVNILNYFQALKNKSLIPKNSKYIWLDDAKKIANYYTGNVKVPFAENRNAFINSSSGTTIGGVTKSAIATNESVIAQLLQGYHADILYNKGKKCLTDFPPTASTALNCLFLLPLYHGMTLINDPRVSEEKVYEMMMKYKPQVTIKTGSFWESFFREVEKEIAKGKIPDLSYLEMPIIGGEGSIPEDFYYWNELLQKCGSPVPLFSGSGMSEAFSVTNVEKQGMKPSLYNDKYPVISVGIPYPGITVGIFDELGNELGYHQRGELRIKSNTLMKGYYQKPELTAETIDQDGWLHTGDMYHIEEDGRLRIWGRLSDKVYITPEKEVLLFDIANHIRSDEAIKYCIVNAYPLKDGTNALLAHIIFMPNFNCDKMAVIRRIDSNLPNDINIAGYKEHQITFNSSKTTAKKDRNSLMLDLDGYLKPDNNGFLALTLIKDDISERFNLNYNKLEKPKTLTLTKNK
ncbi:MAG: class I adenylate-forming enzyme family protein [Bacilli bacterium]|nr:class I adenylate-forming enzyme family protein [Bacilli bacterium]